LLPEDSQVFPIMPIPISGFDKALVYCKTHFMPTSIWAGRIDGENPYIMYSVIVHF